MRRDGDISDSNRPGHPGLVKRCCCSHQHQSHELKFLKQHGNSSSAAMPVFADPDGYTTTTPTSTQDVKDTSTSASDSVEV